MAVSKEHILAELRRTATPDGQAVGRERFFAETGIREADWSGKYWVRWSDAIAEAGLKPSRFNEPLPEELLLAKLAELARDLGRLPVTAELQIKRASDSTFPNDRVFTRRFGGMRGIRTRLLRFARERGMSDLAGWCLAEDDAQGEEQQNSPAFEPTGFVYLLRSGSFYKIGRTNAVGRRERELAIQLPERANVVHAIKTDDPAGIEDYWHRRFQAHRQNGEWFKLSAADVAAFRRRKFQ